MGTNGHLALTRDPSYKHGLTLIPTWVRNHMPSKVGWNYLSMLGFKLINVCKKGPRGEINAHKINNIIFVIIIINNNDVGSFQSTHI